MLRTKFIQSKLECISIYEKTNRVCRLTVVVDNNQSDVIRFSKMYSTLRGFSQFLENRSEQTKANQLSSIYS